MSIIENTQTFRFQRHIFLIKRITTKNSETVVAYLINKMF